MGDKIHSDNEGEMTFLQDSIFDDDGYDSDEYYGISRVDAPLENPDNDLWYLPPQD